MTTRSANTPSSDQLREVFGALVGNGLDFIARSTGEIEKEQKFSVAHFATGLELILKARLFQEHWTLIAVEPHRCAWSAVKDGTVITLAASELCAAITTTTGTPLNHEKGAFEAVFQHRNRVLHWAPHSNLALTVAEQCRSWHHLHRLLTGRWRHVFDAFRPRIDRLERQLQKYRSYLEVRFHELGDTLKGPENAGRLLVCPACTFRAGVGADGLGRVLPFECRVCGYTATAWRADDGTLEHREPAELLDELDPTPLLSPKEMSTYEPDRSYCGECFDPEATVAADGDDYVCVSCGARFEPDRSSTCESCNAQWFGWDAEGSELGGCEHCDGRDLGD